MIKTETRKRCINCRKGLLPHKITHRAKYCSHACMREKTGKPVRAHGVQRKMAMYHCEQYKNKHITIQRFIKELETLL